MDTAARACRFSRMLTQLLRLPYTLRVPGFRGSSFVCTCILPAYLFPRLSPGSPTNNTALVLPIGPLLTLLARFTRDTVSLDRCFVLLKRACAFVDGCTAFRACRLLYFYLRCASADSARCGSRVFSASFADARLYAGITALFKQHGFILRC